MAKKKKYYAVAVGKVRGIFGEWFGPQGAEQQVRGYPGAVYKGFETLAEARDFLENPRGRKSATRAAGKGLPFTSKPAAAARPTDRPNAGQIIIYTDGGALNNPGPGGYGAVIANGDDIKELSGGFRLTTNNRMELMACIIALQSIKKPSAIRLFSDSRYVVNGITKGWAAKWKANGWMRTKNEPAVNPDLWEQLLALCEIHTVEFCWIKGHAGIPANERCDALAVAAASKHHLPADTVYEKTVKRT